MVTMKEKHRSSVPTPPLLPARIDLRSLSYLVTIVEEGSLVGAAARLGITQSALSRSVQAFERTLSTRLLDRGKRGAAPTALGALLVERGRHLLSSARALSEELDLMRGAETGRLTLGVGTYAADISVATAVTRLVAEKPSLQVRVIMGDWSELTERVLAGTVDLAICEVAAASDDPRLTVEALPVHRGVLFCRQGHPLTSRHGLSLESIREYPMALTAVPSRLAPILASRTTGGVAAPMIHLDTFQMARTVVLGSDAVGAAAEAQIRDDIEAGRVVVLPLEAPMIVTGYGFISPAGRTLSPAVRRLMEHVRAVEAALHESDSTPALPVPPSRRRRSSARR